MEKGLKIWQSEDRNEAFHARTRLTGEVAASVGVALLGAMMADANARLVQCCQTRGFEVGGEGRRDLRQI